MNKSVDVISEDLRLRPKKSEVNRLFGSNKLLKSITNWQPRYEGIEGFENGLEKTIEWFTKPENLAFYKTGRYSI